MTADRFRRRAGGATAPLLLLIVLLAAGGYNYHRNMDAEKQDEGARPFSSYSDGDLEQLRDAYGAEVAAYQRRYEASQQRRVRASGDGIMGERVDEFEQIQRNSLAVREATAEVADREARLRTIEKELAYRSSLEQGLALHLKRLTRI